MSAPPRLSIVVPAYNEEKRIGSSLEALIDRLAGSPGGAEVVVVDDGSTDGTAGIVEARALRPAEAVDLRLLRNGANRGKGYSIKHGVLLARGAFVLLTDADLSTPLDELPGLLARVESGACDIAIGSRGLPESRIERRQPAWREAMGRTFNLLVRALTGLRYRDTQCGFKVLRRETALPVFRAARVERFAWDVEVLYLARKAGLRVDEVPVTWRDAAGSKVRAFTDSLAMLRDILRIVWRDRRGRYGRLGEAAAAARPS